MEQMKVRSAVLVAAVLVALLGALAVGLVVSASVRAEETGGASASVLAAQAAPQAAPDGCTVLGETSTRYEPTYFSRDAVRASTAVTTATGRLRIEYRGTYGGPGTGAWLEYTLRTKDAAGRVVRESRVPAPGGTVEADIAPGAYTVEVEARDEVSVTVAECEPLAGDPPEPKKEPLADTLATVEASRQDERVTVDLTRRETVRIAYAASSTEPDASGTIYLETAEGAVLRTIAFRPGEEGYQDVYIPLEQRRAGAEIFVGPGFLDRVRVEVSANRQLGGGANGEVSVESPPAPEPGGVGLLSSAVMNAPTAERVDLRRDLSGGRYDRVYLAWRAALGPEQYYISVVAPDGEELLTIRRQGPAEGVVRVPIERLDADETSIYVYSPPAAALGLAFHGYYSPPPNDPPPPAVKSCLSQPGAQQALGKKRAGEIMRGEEGIQTDRTGTAGTDVFYLRSGVQGRLDARGGNDVIVINGRIQGKVYAGSGNDVVCVGNGVQGHIDGGSGKDALFVAGTQRKIHAADGQRDLVINKGPQVLGARNKCLTDSRDQTRGCEKPEMFTKAKKGGGR